MRIISWNVNGIKSITKKGLDEFFASYAPDICCLQETRSHYLEAEEKFPEYKFFWNPAERKGYSGTATLVRKTFEPQSIRRGLEDNGIDVEGRVLTLDMDEFFLVNVYTLNAQRGLTRLGERMEWDAKFLTFVANLDRIKPVVFCGDLNVAHQEIDLANPKSNKKNAGFTLEERAGFSKYIEAGFVDTFREFNQEGGHYTWWSVITNARERNVGWRIDYFVVSRLFLPKVRKSTILSEVYGSDHCPIFLELNT